MNAKKCDGVKCLELKELEVYNRKNLIRSEGFVDAMNNVIVKQSENILTKYFNTCYYDKEGNRDESPAIDDLKTELDILTNKMTHLVLFMNDELTNQKEENTDESD